MKLSSFAQLKRELKPGIELKLVDCNIPGHKMLGVARKIIVQQSNAIKFSDDSWLGLGSTGETAKDYTFQENGFTLDNRYRDENYAKYGIMLKYEFVNLG